MGKDGTSESKYQEEGGKLQENVFAGALATTLTKISKEED